MKFTNYFGASFTFLDVLSQIHKRVCLLRLLGAAYAMYPASLEFFFMRISVFFTFISGV